MKGKILFGVMAAMLVFAFAATGERPDEVKASHAYRGSTFEMLDDNSIPHLINYQGVLTDPNDNPITGVLGMTFSIWDAATGGNELWSETQSSVAVNNGLFNVLLGSVNLIPPSIFAGTPRWLQTQVGTELLSPRKEIVSVGHAFRAEVADTAGYSHNADMVDGQHASDFLSTANDWGRSGVATDLYEGTTTLTDRYVMEDQANAITSDMIVNDAVTSAKIQDGTIQQIDLSFTLGLGDGHSLDAADGDPVDAVYVDNDGDVGIGTTSPYTDLTLDGSIGFKNDTTPMTFIYESGTTNPERPIIAHSPSYPDWGLSYRDSDDVMIFQKPWTSVMAVDLGSQKVGIGTAEPGQKLDVDGNIQVNNKIHSASFGFGILDAAHGKYILQQRWDVANGDYVRIGTGGNSNDDEYIRITSGEGIQLIGGYVGIGTEHPRAKLDVVGKIRISDSFGDPVVEIGEGLDYAEGFNVSIKGKISPGSVLIIDPDNPGKLTISSRPYDSKVAGIVTGANGQGSGVRLGLGQFDYDVALAGRVYCNVDATEEGIEPGDLLTTSARPGYAMKATDYTRAQGAILGKALEKLEDGEKGQILVLVTLQ